MDKKTKLMAICAAGAAAILIGAGLARCAIAPAEPEPEPVVAVEEESGQGAQADDPLVDLNEVLFIPHAQLLVSNHEAVVPQRLNFQIIVKIHQSDDLFLRSFFPDCLIKLSGLAGGTDE